MLSSIAVSERAHGLRRPSGPVVWGVLLALTAVLPLSAQVQIIPQVVDGNTAGNHWSTTIVLVNRTSTAQNVQLTFHQRLADGSGGTAPWTPAFLENISLNSISIPAGSALFLHTPGTAAFVEGWGELSGSTGVAGYAIFTQYLDNGNQDATAPAVPASNRILIPFDNTSGLVSAFAIVNPTASAENVQVNIRTSDGTVTSTNLPAFPAGGHRSFLMAQQFPSTAGKSGLAEFYVTSGSISMISLRANPKPAFTSAPVYFQTGTPVIGAASGNAAVNNRVQIISQIADGQGWATTIVLTNTTTSARQVTLNFHQWLTGGATTAWIPPFKEAISLPTLNLPAGSTIFLHTPGTAAGNTQGWADMTADTGVEGYAIYTYNSQDATAPAVSASSRILVPFDNTSGLVTAVALVNPNSAGPETMSVNLRTTDGTTTSTTAPTLPALGQITFLFKEQFPDTAGKSGLAEFYVPSGTISGIALRANPTLGLTSAPVYSETGSTIITMGGGGNTGGGGGTTGGTTPSQAEVDAWIAQGFYRSGVITLDRSTAYTTTDSIGIGGATGGTTIKKDDSFFGQFVRVSGADFANLLRGQVPAGFPNTAPPIGTCTVYSTTSFTNPYPNLTTTSLDAGPQLTVNGPNGTRTAPKQTTQGGTFYTDASMPNTYLTAGDYTLSGPSGADVGAFSGGLRIAQDFVVTDNPDNFKVINRSNPITASWTGGESGTIVTITGSSGTIDLQTSTVSGTAFVCRENVSAGHFTVPASVLSQLPPSPVISAGGFSIVTRGGFSVTDNGNGVRFTNVPGLDILTAINSWTWSFTPQYQ